MLPLSALFAVKSRECRQVGKAPLTGLGSLGGLCQQANARFQASTGSKCELAIMRKLTSFQIAANLLWRYSARKARIGSMLEARLAGT
jgi:hypothetical protein